MPTRDSATMRRVFTRELLHGLNVVWPVLSALLLTTVALGLGLVLAFVFQPGVGMNVDPKTLDAMIAPLWGEKDEAKRLAGYKAVDKYIAENALVIPLFQYSQTVVHRKGLGFTPHGAGFVLPQAVSVHKG